MLATRTGPGACSASPGLSANIRLSLRPGNFRLPQLLAASEERPVEVTVMRASSGGAAPAPPSHHRREKETGMSHDDVDYYQRRAEQQIALAQRSEDRRAVQAHYELATAYLDRIHGEGDVRAVD